MTDALLRRPTLYALGPCAVGTALLVARPWVVPLAADRRALLILLFASVGAVGAWWPLAEDTTGRSDAAGPLPAAVALVAGAGAFAAGRLVMGGEAAVAFSAGWVALNTLAAVCEEAFFRRLVYGALQPGGAAVAVAGSAALFAVAHVTVWGAWVLPLDLAGGLVLSWQRWASGRWSVPAVTHVLANLLALR